MASAIASELAVLRRCAAAERRERPSLPEATQALSRVANAGEFPAAWVPALTACAWKPIFSAKPDALKAAAAGKGTDEGAPSGRYLDVDARQVFTSGGEVESGFRLLWGALRVAFCGAFEMADGRRRIPHTRAAGC